MAHSARASRPDMEGTVRKVKFFPTLHRRRYSSQVRLPLGFFLFVFFFLDFKLASLGDVLNWDEGVMRAPKHCQSLSWRQLLFLTRVCVTLNISRGFFFVQDELNGGAGDRASVLLPVVPFDPSSILNPLPIDSRPENEQPIATVPTANGGTRRKHHRPWTLREVMTLVEGVARCGGGKWADIKKLAFSNVGYRTAVDLKVSQNY